MSMMTSCLFLLLYLPAILEYPSDESKRGVQSSTSSPIRPCEYRMAGFLESIFEIEVFLPNRMFQSLRMDVCISAIINNPHLISMLSSCSTMLCKESHKDREEWSPKFLLVDNFRESITRRQLETGYNYSLLAIARFVPHDVNQVGLPFRDVTAEKKIS